MLNIVNKYITYLLLAYLLTLLIAAETGSVVDLNTVSAQWHALEC